MYGSFHVPFLLNIETFPYQHMLLIFNIVMDWMYHVSPLDFQVFWSYK